MGGFSFRAHDMWMFGMLGKLVFVGGVTGLVALAFYPYHDGVLRYGFPLSLAAAWAAGLMVFWRWKPVRMMVALPFLLASPFLLLGLPLESSKLHDYYVTALRRMEGAPYVWGGERKGGIDCSGLPRRALRDALWQMGLETGNGTAFRRWAEQWWFDASAKALGENYRGFTRPMGMAGKLRDLDFYTLSPGDMGVTADGRHLMVFLGDGEWIQADPGSSRVTIEKPVMCGNVWFDAQVTMHRWMLLE